MYKSYYSKLLNGKSILLLGVQFELIPSSHLTLRSRHFRGVNMKPQQ